MNLIQKHVSCLRDHIEQISSAWVLYVQLCRQVGRQCTRSHCILHIVLHGYSISQREFIHLRYVKRKTALIFGKYSVATPTFCYGSIFLVCIEHKVFFDTNNDSLTCQQEFRRNCDDKPFIKCKQTHIFNFMCARYCYCTLKSILQHG